MTLVGPSDRIASAVAWGGLALLVYLVYLVIEPFLIPLAWAGVLAIVFYPAHAKLAMRWGPGRAAGMSTVAITLILIVPMVLVAGAFVREAIDASARIQQGFTTGSLATFERIWQAVQQRLPVSFQVDLES